MKDYLTQPLAKRLAFHKANPGARKYPAAYGYPFTKEQTGIIRDVDGTAHISNTGGLSLRFVGAADSIARLKHTGWYVDGDQGDTTRGVVYRLPSGRGFLAGYSDPWNGEKDGSGPCCLAFEAYETAEAAARAADHLAENAGERYREDALKSRAEYELGTAEEFAGETREEIRGILAGIRESTLAPSICSVLRAKVRELRREYLTAIREARLHVENPYLLER